MESRPKLAKFHAKTTQLALKGSGVDSHPRIPQTPEEQKSLDAAIDEGPEAFYKWMHGEKSDLAKAVAGMTWSDLGIADPRKTAAEIMEALRG